MAGKVNDPPALLVPVSIDGSFTLRLDDLEQRVRPLAKPPTEEMNGLTVTPANTRIARIGTFLSREPNSKSFLGAGFYETKSRDAIWLVFVDQACTITGTVKTPRGIQVHADISIPKPGLTWLKLHTSDPLHFKLEYTDGQADMVFGVPSLR